MNRPKSPVLIKRVKQAKKEGPSEKVTYPPSLGMSAKRAAENAQAFTNDADWNGVPFSQPSAVQQPTERESLSSETVTSKRYPTAIQNILEVCLKEANDVKSLLKGRNRQTYLKIFEAYKTNLTACDYSIIQGALIFLYTYSRVNSIDEEYARWMVGIYQIPKSHIVSYTSKKVLESIAKSVGVSSVGKSEDLVDRIRTVIDPSS